VVRISGFKGSGFLGIPVGEIFKGKGTGIYGEISGDRFSLTHRSKILETEKDPIFTKKQGLSLV